MPNIAPFPQEVSEGLALKLEARTLAYHSPVGLSSHSDMLSKIPTSLPQFAVASEKQPDLAYLETVLVSTGWNLNDDVFDREEVYQARNSPEDKPFNYEHSSDDIIGHITSNRIVGEQGLTVENPSLENLPFKFHILTGAVLYKFWEKEDLQKRMDGILEGISKGEWFVSMECLFSHFDYALQKGTSQKIIARNHSTAFLTKHLRAYGGDGKFQDYRVGRLLRGIVFSGKGLVRTPANPESVILSTAKFNGRPTPPEEITSGVVYASTNKENIMNETEKRISELEAENKKLKEGEFSKAQAEIVELKKKLTESSESNVKLTESHKQTMAMLEQTKQAAEQARATHEQALTEKDKEILDLKTSLAKSEVDQKTLSRTQQVMSKLGVDEKAAGALVQASLQSGDELFTSYLDALVAIAGKTPSLPPTQTSLPAPMGGKPPVVKSEVNPALLNNVTPVPAPSLTTQVNSTSAEPILKAVAEYFGVAENERK